MNIIYPNASEEREQYSERYELSIERILSIQEEVKKDNCLVPAQLCPFFAKTAGFILQTDSVYRQITNGTFYQLPLEDLQTINLSLYQDILPEYYENSYANPAFAVQSLGNEMGPLLCLLYTELRANIIYAFEQRLFYMTASIELFIEIYNLLEDSLCTQKEIKMPFITMCPTMRTLP